MKKILVTLLLFIVTISFAQEKVLLRLNYEKGDVYQVNASIKQNMGELMNMDINMKMDLKITDVVDYGYITEASFKNVKMDMNAMGQNMKYDSDMKESEMDAFAKGAHLEMKELLKTLIAFQYDKLGKILKAKIITGKGNVKDFEESMNSMVLPEEPVVIGSIWKTSKSTKSGEKLDYIYEVTEINPDDVIVKVSGSVSGEENTISGKGIIDRKTGNMSNLDMDLIIKVKGQKINSKVVMTTTKI